MRLIDADALMTAIKSFRWWGVPCTLKLMFDYLRVIIKDQPTIDAVPVVRCRDCKHFVNPAPYDPCECMKWTVKWGVAYVEPNDFCSYGERKE